MGSGIGIVSLLDSGIWVLTVASDCGSIAVNRSADMTRCLTRSPTWPS